MGNELQCNNKLYIDSWDDAIQTLEKFNDQMTTLGETVAKKVFEMTPQGETFDFSTIDKECSNCNSQKAKTYRSNYMNMINKNSKLRDVITGKMKVMGGVDTVAKYAFRTQQDEISLEGLGFEQTSTDQKNRLPYYLKHKKLEIKSMKVTGKENGAYKLEIELKNLTDNNIYFNIKAGTVFETDTTNGNDDQIKRKQNSQSLGCNEETSQFIPKNASKEIVLPCSCINQELTSPSGNFMPTLLRLKAFEKVAEQVKEIVLTNENKDATARAAQLTQNKVWQEIKSKLDTLAKIDKKYY